MSCERPSGAWLKRRRLGGRSRCCGASKRRSAALIWPSAWLASSANKPRRWPRPRSSAPRRPPTRRELAAARPLLLALLTTG
uniref:Uncharacterized protein n=1 Tax=Macrostomum lignano TaxID=282301 RepID=A0A1I8IVL8_9PLAT